MSNISLTAKMSILNATDFYKTDHRRQYPEGTEIVYSNMTARKSMLPNIHQVVFFGLQGFIMSRLQYGFNGDFFLQPKDSAVASYKRRLDNALGKDAVPVEHIAALYDLGYLPLRIKAVPEGTLVPIGVPFLTIVNTDKRFYWLTNFIETLISCEIWKPITNATIAFEYRKLIQRYAALTVGNSDFVQWQGHDFSFRGMSGLEDAARCGAAHLLSFTGTDTIPAIDYLEQYYHANSDKELIGGSVPATEHSVMCMGQELSEIDTFRRLITEIYPSGVVSIVSDTWDYWNVLTNYAEQLKDVILARNGKVVFRPDSGDPVKIIVGDPDAPAGSPQRKGSVEVLSEIFGATITNKYHKTLNSHVGLIYGDSITLERAQAILEGLHQKGFSSDNIVFGIGSYTYQYNTRDTFGMAVKSTYGEIDGRPTNISKNPKTDSGKKSARGLLQVDLCADEVVKQECTWEEEMDGDLKTVFENGRLVRSQTLQSIRSRVLGLLQ